MVSIAEVYGVRKADVVEGTKKLYQEACEADRQHMEEVTLTIVGSDVFVWDNLAPATLQRLRAVSLSVAMRARG